MRYNVILLNIILFVLTCCSQDYTPKPRAYLRIDLPEKNYQGLSNTQLPYTFEYPCYAEIVPVSTTENPDSRYWVNIEFPLLNGAMHLTYNHMSSPQQLYGLIDSSYNAMFQIHKDMITGISERAYEDPENNLYGILYELKGSQAASPYQFYVTDKQKHFIRGTLYFLNTPNNDSLAPVINYVKEDIEHLMSSIRWKNRADNKKFSKSK